MRATIRAASVGRFESGDVGTTLTVSAEHSMVRDPAASRSNTGITGQVSSGFREALFGFGEAKGIKGLGVVLYGGNVWATRKPVTSLADFKRLTALRHDLPVLRHGTLSAPLLVDEHVVVLARQDGDTWAITATNNSLQARTVTVDLPFAAGQLKDALGGQPVAVTNGAVKLTVPPLFGRVLVTP